MDSNIVEPKEDFIPHTEQHTEQHTDPKTDIEIIFEPNANNNILDLTNLMESLNVDTNLNSDQNNCAQILIRHKIKNNSRIVIKSSYDRQDIEVVFQPFNSDLFHINYKDQPMIQNQMSKNIKLVVKNYRVNFVLDIFKDLTIGELLVDDAHDIYDNTITTSLNPKIKQNARSNFSNRTISRNSNMNSNMNPNMNPNMNSNMNSNRSIGRSISRDISSHDLKNISSNSDHIDHIDNIDHIDHINNLDSSKRSRTKYVKHNSVTDDDKYSLSNRSSSNHSGSNRSSSNHSSSNSNNSNRIHKDIDIDTDSEISEDTDTESVFEFNEYISDRKHSRHETYLSKNKNKNKRDIDSDNLDNSNNSDTSDNTSSISSSVFSGFVLEDEISSIIDETRKAIMSKTQKVKHNKKPNFDNIIIDRRSDIRAPAYHLYKK